VSARIGGNWGDPGGLSSNPCAAPFISFVSKRFAEDAGPSRAATRPGAGGTTEKLWLNYCEDPLTGARDPANLVEFWLVDITPGDVVRAAYGYVADYLDPPEVYWPNMNRENGWLFVKVPMDFRVNNLGPVTITATATNSLGSATASITATPDLLTFASGEGGSASCSGAEARAGYVPGAPGACAYTYQNSSSIAGGAFGTTMTMEWSIVATPPDPIVPATLETVTGEALPVSEVQAIVTCYGGSC
jgi:hypothetical protein